MSLFSKIISKKDDYFGTKTLILETSVYNLYSYQKKDEYFSIFKYSNTKTTKAINDILKTIRHPNIMNVIICKDSNIQTELLVPLKNLESELTENFKMYIKIQLYEIIDFLNNKCFIKHNNINYLSLFINQKTGFLVLGGFEKSYKCSMNDDFSSDKNQLSEFINNLFGYIPKEQEQQNFYTLLFEQAVLFSVMKENQILEFINFIKNEQNNQGIPEIIKKYIGFLFLDKFNEIKDFKFEVLPDNFKNKIFDGKIDISVNQRYLFLYFIISLDLNEYDPFFTEFIGIMDTNFRIEVLKNQDFFKKKKIDWKKKILFDNLSIGLRSKEEKLQILTLELIKDTLSFYTQSQVKEITKSLSFCKINLTLEILDKNSKIFHEKDQKGFFKLFFIFSDDKNLRKKTFLILKKNFNFFSYKKICLELLPFLSEMIFTSPIFELFDLIRAILDHLEENKNEIESMEIKSKFQKWLPFFRQKKKSVSEQSESVCEQEEWEDDW